MAADPKPSPSPEQNKLFLAEAEKARQEARIAKAQARKEEIGLAKAEHDEEKRLASDEHYRVYRFAEAVGESSSKKLMEQLAVWHRLDPQCDITIEFNSPGGDVIFGLALFDTIQEIRRSGHHVTTSTKGIAASMAGILLQAGDKRVMSAEAWYLIHEASFGASGSFGDVEDKVKWVERVQARIVKIFADRSNLTEAQIKRRWHRTDWWIDSDQALKLGLVDEIA